MVMKTKFTVSIIFISITDHYAIFPFDFCFHCFILSFIFLQNIIDHCFFVCRSLMNLSHYIPKSHFIMIAISYFLNKHNRIITFYYATKHLIKHPMHVHSLYFPIIINYFPCIHMYNYG